MSIQLISAYLRPLRCPRAFVPKPGRDRERERSAKGVWHSGFARALWAARCCKEIFLRAGWDPMNGYHF